MKRFIGMILCVWAGMVNGQSAGSIALQPERPVGGSRVTVVYRPDSVLQKATLIKGVVYIYDTLYHWHTRDLAMKKYNDTTWKGVFEIPADAGFTAYRFTDGVYYDNHNDNGYFWMINSKAGGNAGGAEAGYGLLRSPRYGLGVPGYFDHYSISDTATYMWLSNEILRHRTTAPHALVIPYIQAGINFKGEGALPGAQKAVLFLTSPQATEADQVKAWIILRQYLKDTTTADSLHNALLQKYPTGSMARLQAYKEVQAERDMKKSLVLCQDFVRQYPYTEASRELDQLLGIDYNKVYRSLFAIALSLQQKEIVMQYIGTALFDRLPEVYYKGVQIPYELHKTATAVEIYPLATAIMARLDYFKAHQPAEYWYYSPEEWEVYVDNVFKADYVSQAALEMESGHTAIAMQLVNKAQSLYHYSKAVLNDIQVQLLQKAGNTKEMQQVLKSSIRQNQATAAMIGLLKKQYVAAHPGATAAAADAYLESLKDAHTMELMREEVGKAMIRETAADFTLPEMGGGNVQLAALKGKVVVLDFWATWCAPCKAGMAGMKLVADKYSKDTNVVFFFIDTQEHTPDYKDKVSAFLQQMHYDNFRVLFDNGEETYARYARQIHTSGIPFKVVINQEGVLNFANVGYMGSPTGLADEIGVMIEMARKQGIARSVTQVQPVTLPSAAASYTSEDVHYYNTDSSIHFGGTLTLPVNGTNFPAVVLLSGTGQQDRNGTMAGHQLFAVIADSLSRHGIAVLRVDDRGVKETSGNYYTTTTSEFANDALAGIRFLQSYRGIDPRKIGLAGHSEGGAAACIAATRSKEVAFVITLSAPGIRGLDALLLQNKAIVDQAPITAENKQRFHSANQLFLPTAYRYAADSSLEKQLRAAYAVWHVQDSAYISGLNPKLTDHFFYPFESYVMQATGRWYREFITYDPATIFPLVKVPLLAVNGDKDIISLASENLEGFRKYVSPGLLQTWQVPGINHLYQHCIECTTKEYATIKEIFAPEVLERMVRFIHEAANASL